MSKIRPGRAFAALVAAVIFCMLSQPALAGWESDYNKALEAYEEDSPRQAAKLLRAAIAKKDKEKANAIKASGMFFEPYLPHYYLGLVLFQLEDYEGAVRELKTSESMGVIKAKKFESLYAQLRQTRRLAEAAAAAKKQQEAAQVASRSEPAPAGTGTPSAAKPPAGTPKTTPAKAGSAQGEATRRPASSKSGPVTARPEPLKTSTGKPAPAGPDPALQQAINGAAGEIAKAGKLKVDGGPHLEDSEKSQLDTLVAGIRGAETAREARSRQSELKRAVDSLTGKVEERKRLAAERAREETARQERLAANRALREAMGRVAPTLRDAESFASANGRRLQAGERRSLDSRIAAVKNATSPSAVESAARALRQDLGRLRQSLSERVARVEGEARQRYSEGARAYFEGRYDEALSALDEASATVADDADLHAFIGCALYKKYLLDRSQDPSLKTRAEKAFRDALAIKADYRLDTRHFPPKVIAFFREVASSS
jgi:hypothetical protein